MATHQRGWALVSVVAIATLCQVAVRGSQGSHGPRGVSVMPLLVVESNQPGPGPRLANHADQLNTLLNLLQAKDKRSQDLTDKVLQPGGAGMWFGPRLGRRRKRSAERAELSQMPDADVDNDIPWKLAELLRELQGPRRSPVPCDPSEINCLLANLASGAATGLVISEQEQRPRSEGNLVNFTPRLGRESGEAGEQTEEAEGSRIGVSMGVSRQLRTDSEPVWGFSPRLGRRRLLPPGNVDVHAPAAGLPSGRSARSAPTGEDNEKSKKEHAQL